MPDRYDPKVSPRGGDRKLASDRGAPANDDPLAELAKIVSGRTSGSRSRPASPLPDPGMTSTGADVLGDLENELLNDLQASFATVRDLVNGAPPPSRSEAPTAPSPAPAKAAPPSPFPAQQPRSPGPPPPQAFDQADFDLLAAGLAERLAPEAPPQASPLPPVNQAQSQPEPRPEVRPPRSAAAPSEPRFLSEQVPERIERTRGAESPEFRGFRARASDPAPPVEPQPAAARPPRTRWEKPEQQTSKFAPPRAAQPAKARPPVDDEDLDDYAELLPTDDEIGSDFPLDGFGDLPGEADEAQGVYQDDLASMMPPRRSRAPVVIAAVVGVVVVGAVAFAMFRPGGTDVSGEPPTIVADAAPTKITPDEPATTEADGSNKLIYDRVNPAADGAETTVLATAEEPLAEVPGTSDGQNAISRVIIPGGPGIDQPADEGLSLDGQPATIAQGDPAMSDAAAGEPADAAASIGPRKVRTVIVKPDGTIVESGATDAAAGTAAAAAPAASEPTVAAPVEQAAATQPPEPTPVTDDTAAIAGGSANGELAITPSPDVAALSPPAAAEPPALSAPAPPEPAAAPAPQPEPVVAATEPPVSADVGQAAPIPAGGMLVQVSSQRTEDAARATFRDLQARYPNILGPYDVNIQRADIPDRGTFFRVRVGPFSASDAQRLCNDLKAAGGDCILAQR